MKITWSWFSVFLFIFVLKYFMSNNKNKKNKYIDGANNIPGPPVGQRRPIRYSTYRLSLNHYAKTIGYYKTTNILINSMLTGSSVAAAHFWQISTSPWLFKDKLFMPFFFIWLASKELSCVCCSLRTWTKLCPFSVHVWTYSQL